MVKTTIKSIFIIIAIILLTDLSTVYKENNNDIMQNEIKYDIKSDTYVEVKTDKYYCGQKTQYMQGYIINIKKQSKKLAIITLENDQKELDMQVNMHTYIGNYTKSSKRVIDYLNKGMKIDISYINNNGVSEIVTLNVVE